MSDRIPGSKFPVTIAGSEFKSGADLKRHLRALLHSYGEGDYLSVRDCHFLLAALRRHPEAERKFGVGVWQFQRRTNRSSGRKAAPGFWLLRVDGSEDSFSIYELIGTATVTPRDLFLDKIIEAMREAVAQRMAEAKDQAFALSETIACPITKRSIARDEAHVDHAGAYPFVRIQDDFLHRFGNRIRPSHIDDEGLGVRFKDVRLRDFFRKFHDAKAVLEVVWARANMSKNSSGYRATFDAERLVLDEEPAV